jgi:hypothetical protein
MEADPLQWLWNLNDVDALRDKINDLRTRTMRNFQRPSGFDASQHEVDCGRNDLHSHRMPCSCCKGSFTFEEARHLKGKVASQPIQPNMNIWNPDFQYMPGIYYVYPMYMPSSPIYMEYTWYNHVYTMYIQRRGYTWYIQGYTM